MAEMKTAILYSNPLLGILNPKRKGSNTKRGGEKSMAKAKKRVHRPTLRGSPGNFYVPERSKMFPHNAGKAVSWNPSHHHRKHHMFAHHNPSNGEFWKTSSLLLGGVAVGAYLVQTIPNLLKRISWFASNPTITDIASVVLVGGTGAGLTFMKHPMAKTLGSAMLVTPVAMYALKEAGSYIPSIYLPAATAAAPAAPVPEAKGTSGVNTLAGMGNVRRINSANLQTL